MNRSEFSRTTANSTTIDFFDVSDNPNHYVDEVSPFAFEGVVFTTDQPLRIYTFGRSVRDYPNYAVPVLEVVNGSNFQRHEDLIINIPNSTATAFGLQVGSGRTGDLVPSGTITFSDGLSVTQVLSPSPGFGFAGVTSTNPITSVTITADSQYSLFVTGITLGTVVPEPGVSGFAAVGLLVLALRRLESSSLG